MARIRSIKPEFFTDEDLQDLEADNPGSYCMMTFAALWGHCDKQGVFEWRPRTLGLAIMPFLRFDLSETLDILWRGGFILQFEDGDRLYGFIPTFTKHQRINGDEAKDPPRYPAYSAEKIREAPAKQERSIEEAGKKQPRSRKEAGARTEGKGREGKGKEIEPPRQNAMSDSPEGAEIPPAQDSEFYHAIHEAFLSKNDGKFSNYAKEGKAVYGIIAKAKARAPADPAAFAQSMLDAFWRLKCTGDKFWKGQPFLPSALNADGIWDRVLETMRSAEAMADSDAMAIAKGDIF